MTDTLAPAVAGCAGCGAQLGPGLLACPGCGRLVHADRLRELAARAEAATAAGEPATALALWQEAMTLLPENAGQRTALSERIAALGALAAARPAQAAKQEGGGAGRKTGIAGALGAVLLKGKVLLFFLLTKLKLLLFGLSKLSTLASMGVYFGYMWSLYGWRLGAGVVLSIYIHEMGHVSALRFYGLPAGAPVFIPGLGAFIRLKQAPPSGKVDARIGLAGPVWGLGAAVLAYGLYLATGAPVWAAVARLGAWINLFNLTPVWQLDGARGFHAFTRRQRLIALSVVLTALIVSHAGMLWLVAAGAVYQLFQPSAEEDDWTALGTYVGLVIALTAIEMLPGAPW